MSPELAHLQERVEKGIAWLTEHDPTGAYHLWFEGHILPSSPKPASSAEMVEGYRVYYPQRVNFERLWAAMDRLERKETNAG